MSNIHHCSHRLKCEVDNITKQQAGVKLWYFKDGTLLSGQPTNDFT